MVSSRGREPGPFLKSPGRKSIKAQTCFDAQEQNLRLPCNLAANQVPSCLSNGLKAGKMISFLSLPTLQPENESCHWSGLALKNKDLP